MGDHLFREGRPGEPYGSRHPAKRSPLILLLGTVIVVLILVLVFMVCLIEDAMLPGKAAPEIELELTAGPVLEGSGKYRFEVVALVTGNPTPEVIFNRDDSLGKAGEHRAIIFLDPGEAFALIAEARNSEGSRASSLELTFEPEVAGKEDQEQGREEEKEKEEKPVSNRNPVISGIIFSSTPLFAEEAYSIHAKATDPDGNKLTYSWEISGASFETIKSTQNPMELKTAHNMGKITVKVTVRDGKGGEAVQSEHVMINPVLKFYGSVDESGHVTHTGVVNSPKVAYPIYVGDLDDNSRSRGFLSFNTHFEHGIGGPYTVHKAVLRFWRPGCIYGDPSIFHHGSIAIVLGTVDWGPRPLQASDYNLPFDHISNFSVYNSSETGLNDKEGFSNEKLTKHVQDCLYAGADRIQFRLHFPREVSNGNHALDGLGYLPVEITLKVYVILDI